MFNVSNIDKALIVFRRDPYSANHGLWSSFVMSVSHSPWLGGGVLEERRSRGRLWSHDHGKVDGSDKVVDNMVGLLQPHVMSPDNKVGLTSQIRWRNDGCNRGT